MCKQNHTSINHEKFFNISLEISKVGNIANAIKNFFLPSDKIRGYLCSQCERHVEISKKYDWGEMPFVLVLHLN